jgi:SAM-dependent methyltransferase
MSIRLVRLRDLEPSDKSTLEERLTKFYQTTPALYYQIADQAAEQYVSALLPFHCDLVSRIAPGTKVVELGCGSAHLCRQVEKMGGVYLGMDHDEHLLQRNRERFPRARFLPLSAKLDEQFDVVASLYTIEHVVDPPHYLKTMWNFCKPAGLIAIICPDFVDGESLPPSVFYGTTPRRLREKILSLAFGDMIEHCIDLFWRAERWKRRLRMEKPGAFWINLRPRVLHGANYSIDADAVHLSRLQDISGWLENHGASILATSRSMKNVPESVLRFNCYVVAQKPPQT